MVQRVAVAARLPDRRSLIVEAFFGIFPAEDRDVFVLVDADADAVEAVISPLAVHVKESAHLFVVADRVFFIAPMANRLLGRLVSLGNVIGGEAAETGRPHALPHPSAADLVIEMGELDDYLSFLKGECSKYPLDLLRDAGVDMEQSGPVKTALARFEELVEELDELL
jgi:hypothetical protein